MRRCRNWVLYQDLTTAAPRPHDQFSNALASPFQISTVPIPVPIPQSFQILTIPIPRHPDSPAASSMPERETVQRYPATGADARRRGARTPHPARPPKASRIAVPGDRRSVYQRQFYQMQPQRQRTRPRILKLLGSGRLRRNPDFGT